MPPSGENLSRSLEARQRIDADGSGSELGFTKSHHLRPASGADSHNIDFDLGPPHRVAQLGRPHSGNGTSQCFFDRVSSRPEAGEVLEVRTKDVSGKAGLGIRPCVCCPTLLESSQVLTGHDVMEAHDWLGDSIGGSPLAECVIIANQETTADQDPQGPCDGLAVAPKCRCHHRFGDVPSGHCGQHRVVEGPVGQASFLGQEVVVFPEHGRRRVAHPSRQPPSDSGDALRRVKGEEIAIPRSPAQDGIEADGDRPVSSQSPVRGGITEVERVYLDCGGYAAT